MSQSPRVSQLESLLARVQARAQQPRGGGESLAAAGTAAEVAEPAAVVPPPALELDEAFASDAVPPSVAAAAPDSMDFEELDDLSDVEEVDGGDIDLDEPAPESHSSPVAGSMEQALASAAAQPPLTPPPESGAELSSSVHVPSHSGPTMEQLGETIALDEGPSRDFELDEPMVDSVVEVAAPSSQLEAELPASRQRGFDDKNLSSPPGAREELERVRLGQVATLAAEVVQRPVISTNVVDFVGAHESFMPESFAELLDASLSL